MPPFSVFFSKAYNKYILLIIIDKVLGAKTIIRGDMKHAILECLKNFYRQGLFNACWRHSVHEALVLCLHQKRNCHGQNQSHVFKVNSQES